MAKDISKVGCFPPRLVVNWSNRSEPEISLHVGTLIDAKLVLRVCALNTSKKLQEGKSQFCCGSRRQLPSKNDFQICSAYTCAQRRNYTACSRLG